MVATRGASHSMSSFADQLAAVDSLSSVASLPLTHVTDWAAASKISTEGAFTSAKECKVYKEHLVYAFYGRPAYRFSDTQVHRAPSYAPVCFIIRPTSCDDAVRQIPFDTGAFSQYGEEMHSSLSKDDFALPGGTSYPQKIVEVFWGSNENYFDVKDPIPIKVDAMDIALVNYMSLLSTNNPNIDDRSSSIEVQFASPFTLLNNVIALVVPDEIVSKKLIELSIKNGFELIPYHFDSVFRRGDSYQPIKQAVRSYYKSLGLL